MIELVASEGFNVLEWSFIVVLIAVSLASGLFAFFVTARLVEPAGMRALLRRVLRKSP